MSGKFPQRQEVKALEQSSIPLELLRCKECDAENLQEAEESKVVAGVFEIYLRCNNCGDAYTSYQVVGIYRKAKAAWKIEEKRAREEIEATLERTTKESMERLGELLVRGLEEDLITADDFRINSKTV